MKLLISSAFLILTMSWMIFGEDTLETCSCWEGYRPHMVNDKPACLGILVKAMKPCNMPQAPRCVCDPYQPEVTSITTDDNGTRCSKDVKGVEVKSWPCANQEEWDTFKKSLAQKPHEI